MFDSNDKTNFIIKQNDSPYKKITDQVNSFNTTNSTMKLINNNLPSSSLSTSPLDKVHLTFVGLSNLGNTCFM